jgi:hypothetical protein
MPTHHLAASQSKTQQESAWLLRLRRFLKEDWSKLLVKAIKDFNTKMNQRAFARESLDHRAGYGRGLGMYTSTYISKDGWPESSKGHFH